MGGHKTKHLLVIIVAVFSVLACTRGPEDGIRCSVASGCPELTTDDNAANLSLSCSAVPESPSVHAGEIFDVTLSASGGVTPYWVASKNGPMSFNSSTTVRGGYSTPGQKREFITVYDSSGLSATCPLNVTVEQGAGCEITIADDNYTPAVDQQIQFQFRAFGIPAGKVVTYEFLPDEIRSPWVGYILTKGASTAAFDYRYTSRGIKRPRLFVSTSNSWDVCEIAQLPVRQPDFTVTGTRFAEIENPSTNNDEIELTIVQNGEFSGTIQYDYEVTDANDLSLITVTEDGNKVTIENTTSVYDKVRIKITAETAKGDHVEKTVEIEWVPTTTCNIAADGAGSNDAIIRGDKVSYTFARAAGSDTIEVHDVILPSGAQLVSGRNSNGTYRLPVEIRYYNAGEDQQVEFVAKTVSNKERCSDGNGNDLVYTVDVRHPVACTVDATPWRQNVGEDVELEVRVPSNAGIGPYEIHDVRSDAGSGLVLVNSSANDIVFNSGETGNQIVRFNSGRPGNGITYFVDVDVKDQGDPQGRVFACRTTVTSVLPSSSAACTAHFEREGTLVTQARARDELTVVVSPNFTDRGYLTSVGSEAVPSAYFLANFPFHSGVRFDRSSNQSTRSVNSQFTVRDYYSLTTRSCTANLTIGPSLSCSIAFPYGQMVENSNGNVEGNNTIVISSETSFPGNFTNDPLGKKLVNFTATITRAVKTLTNRFDDKSGAIRESSFTRPVSDGIYNATVTLTGEYTRHGAYPAVSNRVTDSFDDTGKTCSANENMFAHLMRTAHIQRPEGVPARVDDRCFIKATNITPLTINGSVVGDQAQATLWLFGYRGAGLVWTNDDCHQLNSVNRPSPSPDAHLNTTSCTREFKVRDGKCTVAAKAMGFHPTYQNPGDFALEVWITDKNGNQLGPRYHLPNMCQRGSSCSNN